MKFLLGIILLSFSSTPTYATYLRRSPRTAALSPSPSSSIPSAISHTTSTPSSNLNTISTATIPTPTTPAKAKDKAEAFLTAAKATVTPAPEIMIDGAGRVLHGNGAESGMDLQEKWHLTTFSSCHTFDATFIYCGLHEPVLPGGNEIAGAVRGLDARGGIGRAVMVVMGTLIGVDVFLR